MKLWYMYYKVYDCFGWNWKINKKIDECLKDFFEYLKC